MAAVDDLFTCAICLEWFKSPRRLPCQHVYCLQCLRGLKQETSHITCPECRRDHVMPNNRVEKFPVDSRLEQLIDILAKPRPASDDDWRDSSALSKCEHSQPACRECRTNKAQLLETLLQESRQLRADFFTENQIIIRQKQKVRLQGYIENLQKVRMKVVTEIEEIRKELETRKLTLLSIIEEEKMLIMEELCKLDQADTISAENESLLAELVDQVHPTKTLVSLREKLSNQKEVMTSIESVDHNARLLDAKFNRDELSQMIDDYGEFFTAVDYQKDFTLATTLDGSESGSIFKQPWGLTVCPFTDNVYVTDHTSISVYNSDGEYIRHIVGEDNPSGVAFDSNHRVIVASCSKHKVNIYNHDLELVKSFGSQGDKNGQFKHPLGVACDSNDNIYVVDWGNSRIQVFTPDGLFLSTIGRGVHLLQRPRCLQINNRDEIIVTDYNLIVIFSKDGTHLKTITGEGDNKLQEPYGICLDDSDHILIADLSMQKIQVYNDDGTYHCTISQPAAAMTSMRSLAVTKSDVLFITDSVGNEIHIIDL